MPLTKSQIIDQLQDCLPFYSRHECQQIVESLLEIIKNSLVSGEDVLVSGFGKFCVKEKDAHRGRNPSTGEEMFLPERQVVTFKCSGKLREIINNGHSQ